jgi:hypothetical protein
MNWDNFLEVAGDPLEWDEGQVVELLETSSVTIEKDGRTFVLQITPTEITDQVKEVGG